ncbi:sensor histidine kinase [Thalassotalea euphylliae]|uniref:sensor histidine kinase n=1 Tax=Thalassotalea euphylliae TaxID=1655234 RepID=UPI00363C95EA
MTVDRKVIPLRRKFLAIMAMFVTIAFFIAHLTVSHFVFDYLENELKADIKDRANIIAARSVDFIKANNYNEYEPVLANLKAIPRFNYVHVYDVEDGKIDFFSSYNKGTLPTIAPKMDQLEKFKEPVISDKIIEYISPIKSGEELVGYSYIQMTTEAYDQLKFTTFLTLAVGYLLFMAIGAYLTLHMHSMVLQGITQVSTGIRSISQKRDYSQRIESMDSVEFDMLSKNLNILLHRTEKYLQKQDSAEQEILKLNQELEDKVSQRTEALKESNQELLSTLEKLHQFQGQLVESEKMASLGDMVAGVAHEVNTPIGLGVTASTLLSDRLGEIKTAFEDKTLKSSQLRKFLNEGEENVGIIYRNLNRAADLISSFKKVAVDQSSEEDRRFKVSELIDEVILTLAPQLKTKPVDLQIDCPSHLTVVSKPGPLNQILINLIVNSIIHGFENQEEGVINLNIMQLSGQLHISYADNGKGVDQALKNKIFDPFITTKRGEGGSGLGLHLVYNLVTQALGGNILFDSELGHGVRFDINFPVTIVET